MSTTAAIQASNISVKFGHRTILDKIDIEIFSGQVTALLGPNGAGKSTLLKILSGEISSTGKIAYFGVPQALWQPNELAKHLAILPQQSTLSFPFIAQEVVELGALPLNLSHQQISEVALHYMQQTDISDRANNLYPALSGGEKQRLHLARVLTQLHHSGDKKILMLDEPTSALDLAHQHNTLRIARSLARQEQCAVIVVLHDLNLAAQYADRMVMLHNGKLVCDAPPWEALNAERIEQVYGYSSLVAAHPTMDFPMVYPI
ncbi:heme ABC transporter ATP-binding protein [Vibrio anguillarum]|uniref:heme ABC transporter ATP-binding protein n=1 Tax=Vibrio anguillarum TaxID=55601 RepID=UPI001889D13D|nr:heme ABC transporter ATP-binding protein [Vibrio anguillarum]MBF4255169.1 heme ABC transporter ATP-binding protein [Vibrio anguillarum]MBF4276628.1 heme ABC transporter ATP-binding protein [Vibrio anguillarum]MBF4299553.1 heme ABC transporter ATP-binding protein [Vibrio anguillarum]MBF4362121.1 heme ABC transporter ATP-binding protein [Vibrio anguillarum]MBF4398937.1 heme ABC transporter ATP-binding protein [Vibrio anguillarum]